jgi:glutamate dehydrogenase
MVNRMGSTFHFTMKQDTDATAADVARAYAAGREIFQIRNLWRAIEDLDNKVGAETQIQMMGETRRLLVRTTRWLLTNRRGYLDISALVDQFAPSAEHIQACLPRLLRGTVLDKMNTRMEVLNTASVPANLAQRIAVLDALFLALDIIEIANQTETDLTQTTETYFELGVILDLHWLHDRIRELPRLNHWQRTARSLLRDELRAALRSLTQQVVVHTKDMPPTVNRIETWLNNNSHQIEHYQRVFNELKTVAKFDMAIITVAVQEVRNLARVESPPCDSQAEGITDIVESKPEAS